MKNNIVCIYCDESHPIQNDGQDFMVIGALICHKKDYKIVKNDIQQLKKKHGLDLNYEFKWQKINCQRLNLYMDLVDYIAKSDLLKIKINVSTGKNNLKFYGDNYDYNNWYHAMYVNMLKNYLDIHKDCYNKTEFDLLIDRKETISDKRYNEIAKTLEYKFSKDSNCFSFLAKPCDSKEHLLIQCVDVIIGAVSYFQKNKFNNIYKTKIMKYIASSFNVVLGKPTPKSSDKISLYYWKPKAR